MDTVGGTAHMPCHANCHPTIPSRREAWHATGLSKARCLPVSLSPLATQAHDNTVHTRARDGAWSCFALQAGPQTGGSKFKKNK